MHIFQSLDNQALIDMLKQGAIGVLPTDTVYGLVCSARKPEAVERLFTVKERNKQPGTVLAGSIEQLAELGIKLRYLKAVEQYWPNPLSIIIPCGEDLAYLHMGLRSLAVRIPAADDLRALLLQTGPLMTTSANHPKEPVAENITQAHNYFGDTVDFYLDKGEIGHHEPSTIIRIIDDAIEIVREGAIKIDESGKISP